MGRISRRAVTFGVPAGLLLSQLQSRGQTAFAATDEQAYFAMGFRVGEVTQSSAIVWTRLTASPQRNGNGIIPSPPISSKAPSPEPAARSVLTQRGRPT